MSTLRRIMTYKLTLGARLFHDERSSKRSIERYLHSTDLFNGNARFDFEEDLGSDFVIGSNPRHQMVSVFNRRVFSRFLGITKHRQRSNRSMHARLKKERNSKSLHP